jgi:starvation-inducible DNA-binding protein
MIQSVSKQTNSRQVMQFEQSRNTIIEGLQRQVANAFNLYLNYKHYHWQVVGPLFKDLNVIFDEFATEVYNTVEILSERVRTIGQNRLRVKEFPKKATVKPSKENRDIRRMIQEADNNALMVIREIKELIKTSEHVDNVSANILKRLLRIHEKHQWWLHYVLDKRQGLAA